MAPASMTATTLTIVLLTITIAIDGQIIPLNLSTILETFTLRESSDLELENDRAYDSSDRPQLAIQDPDAGRDIRQLIASRGFEFKEYFPRTPDGYRLGVFRIINPYNQKQEPLRPVILSHGYYSSAAVWLWQPGGNAKSPANPRLVRRGDLTDGSLAFVLANHGYDVWLTNFRGNRYAQNNSKTSAGNYGKFWEFSMNEMSRLDIPTFLRFVLKITKQPQIGFVGHSMATTAMFAALATDRDLNDVVRPVIMLSPATRTTNSTSAMAILKNFTPATTFALRYAPMAFGPSLRIGNHEMSSSCQAPPLQPLCLLFLQMALGFDSKQLNQSRLPVYLSHAPEPTSSWVYDHYLQNSANERFYMFDYGPVDNQKRYGLASARPPYYDLSKITNNYIALFYSKKDYVSPFEDVAWLKSQLSVAPMIDYVIPEEDWNHLDFVWARDLDKYINPQVIRALVKAGFY